MPAVVKGYVLQETERGVRVRGILRMENIPGGTEEGSVAYKERG